MEVRSGYYSPSSLDDWSSIAVCAPRLNATVSVRCQPGHVFKSGDSEATCDITGDWFNADRHYHHRNGTTTGLSVRTKLAQPLCELDTTYCLVPQAFNGYEIFPVMPTSSHQVTIPLPLSPHDPPLVSDHTQMSHCPKHHGKSVAKPVLS